MNEEGSARQEPSSRAPSRHTACRATTESNNAEHLYSIHHDSLLSPFFISNTPISAPTIPYNLQRHQPAHLSEQDYTQQSELPYFSVDFTATAEMSRHSSSQSSKGTQQYQLMSSESPADQAKSMSQNNKDQLINSLRTHKVNTITELRRIEKIFAYLNSEEVTEPMTAAWAHYVNSNNLLNELRNLTKKIPFSSECLDEAKALVVADPDSVRSWNYCWLVLVKMEKENLVLKYARALASKRSTWGDRQPTADDARKFINACVAEWTLALRQLLKHWDQPPSTTGN